MINKIDILNNKLNNLYKTYEEKCWLDSNNKITLLLEDNCIAFYYGNNKKNIDEFCISFKKKERKIYKYLSLNLFDDILGDVYIYKDDNIFYNLKHKPYLSVIVNDEDLLATINDIVFKQEEEFIQEKLDSIYKRKPFKIYRSSFLNSVDERIEITKKRLRSYNWW